MSRPVCVVCAERPQSSTSEWPLCPPCCTAIAVHAERLDVLTVLEEVARRARAAERARWRALVRSVVGDDDARELFAGRKPAWCHECSIAPMLPSECPQGLCRVGRTRGGGR